MRVLFLTHRLPYAPNRGDRVRALHMLRLMARSFPVDLVSLVHSRDEEQHADDLRDLASSVTVARVNRALGYGRALAAVPGSLSFTHAILDAKGLRPALEQIVARNRPDVVLAFCSSMARFAMEPPLDGIPMVLDMVDVDSEKWRTLGEQSRPPARWIYSSEARRLSAFEARAAMRAHTVVVVNERERALVQRLAPASNAHVLPVGVDNDYLKSPNPPSDELRVTFCGVMNYRPNAEGVSWFAEHVWPAVRQRHPGARLSLVGSEPTPAVRRLPSLDPTIEVTGTVSDVRPYLWRSAISIAPLLLARGMQTKVLEALAAGLPCVLTPVVADGLPSSVLAGCVVAADAGRFADAVSNLLNRAPHERRQLADTANLDTMTWSAQLAPLLPILTAAAG